MIDLSWLAAEFPDLTNIRRLGQGGQKEVFSAVHAVHGPVVLKVFHISTERERALREARAALELAGARVPQTFEIGSKTSPVGEVLWLIEHYIDGANLRTILSTRVLTDDELLTLAEDVIDILAAAEEQSIVHRDVKPDNIIMGPDGRFWLVDFGLARHLSLDSLTQTGLPFGVGTPGYAPPEQFRNLKDEIDGRADLFGIGVTLFEAAEGTNPLRDGAGNHVEMLRRTEIVPLPRLTRTVHNSPDFSDIVFAITRPRRSHRPADVRYVREWLRDLLRQ